jgi:hypothetical protein
MKKLAAVFILGAFLWLWRICHTVRFWKHDSLYKNWDHTWFSLSGYKSPTGDDSKKSMEQAWWVLKFHISQRDDFSF